MEASENSMLLLPQGWLLWHYFVLGCFAPRNVDVGWGQFSIFVFLMLSREWGNAVSSRFPCLIPGVGRFSTPLRVVESQWVGEEGRETSVLNVGCAKCGGMVRLSAWNSYLQENFEVIWRVRTKGGAENKTSLWWLNKIWDYRNCAISCYWPAWGGVRNKWCCGHKEGYYIATHQGEKFYSDFIQP